MGWAVRNKRPIPPMHSQQREYELNDYSLGMNSFLSNDKFPLNNGGANTWQLAQDARIPSLGEYETRKGFDVYSVVADAVIDQSQVSATGAANQVFSETTYLAQKWTSTHTGNLSLLTITLKNVTSGSGTIAVEHWTDNAGSPGVMVAKTTIANNQLTSSYADLNAYFAEAPSVATGTSYWIVVHIQLFGGNSYNWQSTTAATTAKTSSDGGLTWSATSYALIFREWVCNSTPVTGLYRAYKSDGTKKTLFTYATNLVDITLEVSGTLATIKSGLNASATAYRFATFNDVVYYVNGYDGLRKWDFTTESQVNSTNYSLICTHKGLLFLAGGADPNAVVFSNFGLAETYTSTDLVYADVPKNGDPATALVSLNGSLFIFSKGNKFIMSGDNDDDFRVDESPDQKGTYTQETVCQDNNYMYFLSDDGVYRSNGSEAQLMSENIYNDIQAIPDKTKCVMAVNQGRLYLWYPTAGSGYNNRCFVWNLNYTSSGRDCIESLDTNAFVTRAVSCPADNDQLLVGSSRMAQVYWQELNSNDYSNAGGDLNFELRTNYMTFDSPAQLHEVRYWKPRFARSSTNNTVDCSYAYDLNPTANLVSSVDVQGSGFQWGDGTKWGSVAAGGSGATWGTDSEVMGSLYVPGEYRRIQLRYKHSGARQYVRFLGQSLIVQIRRMR